MDVPFEKLKINKEGIVNVINVKNIPEMVGGLRKENGILPAYHMSKEHWITILLDGTVPKEKTKQLEKLNAQIQKYKKILHKNKKI